MDIIAESPQILFGNQQSDLKVQIVCVLAPISGVVVCYLSQAAVQVLENGKVNKDSFHLSFE